MYDGGKVVDFVIDVIVLSLLLLLSVYSKTFTFYEFLSILACGNKSIV